MPTTTFGPYSFDSASGALWRDGKPVALGGRGVALLAALLDGDGAVVGKDALIEAAWPGTIVEEGNLSVQIAALRKALGARPDGTDWIATVPRVGYRLVRERHGPASDDPEPRLPTIAVLPFANLSSDPEQAYFADGVVEDILTALSRFRSVSVVARNSSFVYKDRAVDVRQIARELGASYVLEGSLRKAGGRLRITAQLIAGASGAHLWADAYDGALEDVFAFQDSITEGVVSIVEPMIVRAEIERARQKPPSSIGAYDLYLQSLAMELSSTPANTAKAIELIERSLALDPDFPPAMAQASSAYGAVFDRQMPGASEEAREKGFAYARAALAAAGTDPNVRAVAALGVIMLGREFDSGMMALRRAVSENPNSITVLGFAGVGAIWGGDLDESERYFERAIRLHPVDTIGHWLLTGMAHIRLAQGRHEEGLEFAIRAYAVDPRNPITHWMIVAASAHLGRLAEAREWCAKLLAVDPRTTIASVQRGQPLKDQRRIDVLLQGLRLAGLPEV